jgi:GTP-binding protein Era
MSEDKNYDGFEQEEFDKSYTKEDKEFKKIINQKLIIALYGEVNTGKSSTVNALLGKRLASVSPYAGHSPEVKLFQFDKNVWITDTPGLDDVNEENSRKTEDFIEEKTDIILFFFNAAVGCKRSLILAYNDLKKLEKPILIILNKIDFWYKDNVLVDKEALDITIMQIEDNTKGKVIPISAKDEINIELLNSQIVSVLEKVGKDLLFLKLSRYKDEQVRTWINGATISAFGIGAIPLPGADIIPLTSLQIGLAMKIAYIYGYEESKKDIMTLIGATITGTFGKQLFRIVIQFLKGAGWFGGPIVETAIVITAGTIAASITFGFGWACNAYYKSGMIMDLGKVGEIFKEKYTEYKKLKDSEKK